MNKCGWVWYRRGAESRCGRVMGEWTGDREKMEEQNWTQQLENKMNKCFYKRVPTNKDITKINKKNQEDIDLGKFWVLRKLFVLRLYPSLMVTWWVFEIYNKKMIFQHLRSLWDLKSACCIYDIEQEKRDLKVC